MVYDVFIGESASGNPCAVVELDNWPDAAELLKLTQQIGQPVTSFVMESKGQFHIRWFALQSEINLCGHGSLGAGAAILARQKLNEVTFYSQYGNVVISRQGDWYGITLPAWQPQSCVIPDAIKTMAEQAVELFSTRDLVLVLPDEEAVSAFQPDCEKLKEIRDYHALIVTANSGNSEYVLRYFAPGIGIAEDQATGSAHCSLAPYWLGKFGTNALTARQLSASGGLFRIEKGSGTLLKVHAQLQERVANF